MLVDEQNLAFFISVAARFEAWVDRHPLDDIAGSNPAGGMNVRLLSVVCCQVQVSALGRSLV